MPRGAQGPHLPGTPPKQRKVYGGTPREETLLGKERRLDELRERAEKAEARVERLKGALEEARVRALRYASGELCAKCHEQIKPREAAPAPAPTAGEEPASIQSLHPDQPSGENRAE
jgi:hypothetical protein